MKQLLCTIFACIAFLASYAQGYKMENGEVVPEGAITFATGSDKINPESEIALNNIKKYLTDKSYISLMRIEGHVAGSSQDQALSEARANAIAKWLTDAGIDCKRIIPVGFGNTKPVSETQSANTRIAFVNAALKGRPIGGMPVDGGAKVAGDPCK